MRVNRMKSRFRKQHGGEIREREIERGMKGRVRTCVQPLAMDRVYQTAKSTDTFRHRAIHLECKSYLRFVFERWKMAAESWTNTGS